MSRLSRNLDWRLILRSSRIQAKETDLFRFHVHLLRLGLLGLVALGLAGAQADAQSVINFDDLTALPDYGVIPGTYDSRLATTPNISVAYHTQGNPTYPDNLLFWHSDYGDLQNVAFAANQGYVAEVDLIPDPGYSVTLSSFDMAGWPHTDLTNSVFALEDATGTPYPGYNYASGGPVTIIGATTHSHFTPGLTTTGEIRIVWGTDWNVGIDNISFSQAASGVPEPGAYALLGSLGLTGAAFLRRRRAR